MKQYAVIKEGAFDLAEVKTYTNRDVADMAMMASIGKMFYNFCLDYKKVKASNQDEEELQWFRDEMLNMLETYESHLDKDSNLIVSFDEELWQVREIDVDNFDII